jgi:hypothetical protein
MREMQAIEALKTEKADKEVRRHRMGSLHALTRERRSASCSS